MIVTISKIDFVTLKSVCNADLGRKKAVAAKLTKMANFASSAFFQKKLKVMLPKIVLAQSIKA